MPTKQERKIEAMDIPVNQKEYLLALEKITKILPSKPPRIWHEKRLAYARGLTEIIRQRLETMRGRG